MNLAMNSRSSIVAALIAVSCAATTPVAHEVTIEEAEQIRDVAARYLLARPDLAQSLPLPGHAVVDAWGTVRLGEWILESDRDELLLTYRVAHTEANFVPQEMVVARAGAGWQVVRNGEVIYHLHQP